MQLVIYFLKKFFSDPLLAESNGKTLVDFRRDAHFLFLHGIEHNADGNPYKQHNIGFPAEVNGFQAGYRDELQNHKAE